MAIDLSKTEQRARWAYERARLESAIGSSAPLLGLVALAIWLAPRPAFAAAVGGLLISTSVVLLWRGMVAGAAVAPGVLIGLVPLGLTHLANGLSPGCETGDCSKLCTYACVAGGTIAGLWLVRTARHHRSRGGFLAAAMPLVMMTGSLGCGCVGYTGMLALAATVSGISLVPLLLWSRRAI